MSKNPSTQNRRNRAETTKMCASVSAETGVTTFRAPSHLNKDNRAWLNPEVAPDY